MEEWKNVPSGSLLTTVWGSQFCKSSFGDSKNISYKHNNGFYDFGIEISDCKQAKKHRSIDDPFEPSMKHNHNNDGKQIVFWGMSSC